MLLCITNGSPVELFALLLRRSLLGDVLEKGVRVFQPFLIRGGNSTTAAVTKAKHTSVSAPVSMLFCITNGSPVELFALLLRRSLLGDVLEKGVRVFQPFLIRGGDSTTAAVTKAKHTSASAPVSMLLCITNGSPVELFALLLRRSLLGVVSENCVKVFNLF